MTRLLVGLGVALGLLLAVAPAVCAQAELPADSGDAEALETESEATSEPTPGEPNPSRLVGIEWLGMNFGSGFWYNAAQDTRAGIRLVGMRADVNLFTLLWPQAYWTILEVHPVMMYGMLGGGTRAGYRLPLVADCSHEMRFGLAVSGDAIQASDSDMLPLLTVAPHVQYVATFEHGSVGVGLDLMFSVNLGNSRYYHETSEYDYSRVMFGPALYFRWAWGSYDR